jgi:hypothetical protein
MMSVETTVRFNQHREFDNEMEKIKRLHMILERREYSALIQETKFRAIKAIEIQRWYRGSLGKRKSWSLKLTRSVLLIQNVWKISHAKWHSDSSKGLKALWNEYTHKWNKQDTKKEERHIHKIMSSTAPCSDCYLDKYNQYQSCRSFSSRLMQRKMAEIMYASIRIQCIWRCTQARQERWKRAALKELAKQHRFASIIQEAWGIYSSWITALAKQDNDAATCIQRASRGRAARRSVAIFRVERKEREKTRRKLDEMIAMREALKTPPTPPQQKSMMRLAAGHNHRPSMRRRSLAAARDLGDPSGRRYSQPRADAAHGPKSGRRRATRKAVQPNERAVSPVKHNPKPGGQELDRPKRVRSGIAEAIEVERLESEKLAILEAELQEQLDAKRIDLANAYGDYSVMDPHSTKSSEISTRGAVSGKAKMPPSRGPLVTARMDQVKGSLEAPTSGKKHSVDTCEELSKKNGVRKAQKELRFAEIEPSDEEEFDIEIGVVVEAPRPLSAKPPYMEMETRSD